MSPRSKVLMLSSTALALTLALVPDAQALSCLAGPDNGFPSAGAVDVPTNVVPRLSVLLDDPTLYDHYLVDELGEEVEVSPVVAVNPGSSSVVYLYPSAPLSPDTAYSVYSVVAGEAWGEWAITEFTTGSGPSEESAVTPVVRSTERDRGSDVWGGWEWLNLIIDDGASSTFHVEVSDSEDFDVVQRADIIGWLADDAGAVRVSVGDGVCGGPIALDGERYVRVASVSMTGEISEWATAERVGGCSSAPGAATALSAMLGLLAMFGRRRRS